MVPLGATSCSGWIDQGTVLGSFPAIGAFGQVQRRRQILDLTGRQGDAQELVGTGVKLLDHHAIVKRLDRDVFLQMRLTLVNKGDDRGVKFVLDGEHGPMIGCGPDWRNGGLIWIKDRTRQTDQRRPKGIIMDISQSSVAFGLTRGMARSVGVNLIEAVTDGWYSRRELAQLVQHCAECGLTASCSAWLSVARHAASLPGYCANKSEIEALRL